MLIARPAGSRTTVSRPGRPRRTRVESELQPGQTSVVRPGVTEYLRPHVPLRVDALLLGDVAEPDDVLLFEQLRALGIGLARDVDEALRLVREEPLDLLGIEAQRLSDHGGHQLRIVDLLWVRVDRRRLPADRQLDALAVVDRAARARVDRRLAVLALRHAAQVLRAHALQPGGPDEHGQEREGEDDQQQADAAVGHLRRHSPLGPTFK